MTHFTRRLVLSALPLLAATPALARRQDKLDWRVVGAFGGSVSLPEDPMRSEEQSEIWLGPTVSFESYAGGSQIAAFARASEGTYNRASVFDYLLGEAGDELTGKRQLTWQGYPALEYTEHRDGNIMAAGSDARSLVVIDGRRLAFVSANWRNAAEKAVADRVLASLRLD